MLKQGLSINTTFYPPKFSLDSTFKHAYDVRLGKKSLLFLKAFEVLIRTTLNASQKLYLRKKTIVDISQLLISTWRISELSASPESVFLHFLVSPLVECVDVSDFQW
jgi:hypothetical protein